LSFKQAVSWKCGTKVGVTQLQHPGAEVRPTITVGQRWIDRDAVIPAEVALGAHELASGGGRKLRVADRNGVDVDGRARVELALLAEPGGEAGATEGAKDGVNLFRQDTAGCGEVEDRKVESPTAVVGAKAGRLARAVRTLSDGEHQVVRASIEGPRVLEH